MEFDVIKKLKEIKLEQLELLDELKYSLEVEKGITTHELKSERGWAYHEEDQKYERGYFHLIDIKQAKIVCSGHIKKIHSYCRIRNIQHEQVKYTGVI